MKKIHVRIKIVSSKCYFDLHREEKLTTVNRIRISVAADLRYPEISDMFLPSTELAWAKLVSQS